MLQKSVKSLRVKLNEFFGHVEDAATAGAFTQARAKLSYKFFKDVNRESYAEGWYSDGDYQRYKGFRLLAIDGSKIRLPESESIREEFGKIRIKNQYMTGSYSGAQSSVMYDVLNECVLDSELAPGKTSELSLAFGHLEFCNTQDLVLFDRGYSGYELFGTILKKELNFVCRCSKVAFNVVEDFLANTKCKDKIVTLVPCDETRRKIRGKQLAEKIQIRLIKVRLSSGETEVLATSLLDCKKYTRASFKHLYFLRWKVETFFDRIKNNLSLENFSGKTANSVKQDYYGTMLIANIESEITGDVDEELAKKRDNKYSQKVSKAVSFNSIKNEVFNLLLTSKEDSDIFVKQLQELFHKNAIPIRPNRSFPRKSNPKRSLNFHKNIKKHVF